MFGEKLESLQKERTPKSGDKGITMMFVGYTDCESDSIRMWDLVTAWVIGARDVIWLKIMFF